MNGITPTRIKAARSRLGLSLAELGRRVGVGERAVWEWEQGRTAPRSEATRNALSAVLFGEKSKVAPMDAVSRVLAGEVTSQRIKAARARLGLSPAGLAMEVGVSERAVSRWEKGSLPKSKAIRTALLAVLVRTK